MTDWEKAIAYWLPDVWPSSHCDGAKNLPRDRWEICPHGHMSPHDVNCPPPSRDLAFRLLDALRERGYCISFDEKGTSQMEVYSVDHPNLPSAMVLDTDDTMEMIIKAAAALARQNEKKE